MAEWDPEGENQNPERDFRRDYTAPKADKDARGVWSIGGDPRDPQATLGGQHVGKGPRSYRRSDERVYEDVCEALSRDGYVDATDVDVKVRGGAVTLSGSVANQDMLRHAQELTACCAGVRSVQNLLVVEPLPR